MGSDHGAGCLHIVIASDERLPSGEWEVPSRDITVLGPLDKAPTSTRVFSRHFLYAVRTKRTGDGCGFQGDSHQSRQAREALAAYLDQALERVPELELFVDFVNATTPGVEPSRYDQIGPDDIRTWRSCFRPGEFLVVRRED